MPLINGQRRKAISLDRASATAALALLATCANTPRDFFKGALAARFGGRMSGQEFNRPKDRQRAENAMKQISDTSPWCPGGSDFVLLRRRQQATSGDDTAILAGCVGDTPAWAFIGQRRERSG